MTVVASPVMPPVAVTFAVRFAISRPVAVKGPVVKAALTFNVLLVAVPSHCNARLEVMLIADETVTAPLCADVSPNTIEPVEIRFSSELVSPSWEALSAPPKLIANEGVTVSIVTVPLAPVVRFAALPMLSAFVDRLMRRCQLW